MIFVFVFSSILFLMNYYVFSRIVWFFGLSKNKIFYGLLVFMTFLFPVIMSINTIYPSIITKYLYFFASLWLWVLCLSIWILFIFEIINVIWKYWFHYNLINNKIWYIVLWLIIWFSWYSVWNWRDLTVKNFDLPMKNLQNNIKIVYLSDMHIDTLNWEDYLNRIIDQVNSLSWDLVVINWDLVDSVSLSYHSFKSLNRIKARVIFTYWNHETYSKKEFVNKLLENTKVEILENKMIEFSWLQIIGLQDMNWFDNKSNWEKLKNLLSQFIIDQSKPSMLVLHEPIAPQVSQSYGIDLQVAWHTHNGQIFPFMFLVKIAFPYINWLYNVNGMYMYVGSGTGTWGPPMRLWSKPLITVLNLIKESR